MVMMIMDSDVVAELFGRYSDMVFRIALNILRNTEEAQDVVIDVFMAMMKQGQFNDERHVKGWLIRTTEHKAINVTKTARMRRVQPMDEILENTLVAPVGIEEREVLDLVMRLPEKLKTTVYMYYFEDMNAAEIAEVLGIGENTVYKRLERGRGILKADMEGDAI